MNGLDIEEVIVVVHVHGRFRWFKSDRDLWVLDLKKWRKDFLDAGFQAPAPDSSERFGIPILNERTVDRFITAMQQFEIDKDDLGKQLAARFSAAKSWWDVCDLFPIMFVDFDRRHICAFYDSGTRMERYFPDGWTGEFEDFATRYPDDLFPQHERFWVQRGIDMLKELNERGNDSTVSNPNPPA
jgi:hypothetical protein